MGSYNNQPTITLRREKRDHKLDSYDYDVYKREVMPEKYFFGRRPPVPLWNKDIKIIIGEPIDFDLQSLKQTAKTVSRDSSIHGLGWPNTTDGLDEAAQKWLYVCISDQIRTILERLRVFSATFKSFNV